MDARLFDKEKARTAEQQKFRRPGALNDLAKFFLRFILLRRLSGVLIGRPTRKSALRGSGKVQSYRRFEYHWRLGIISFGFFSCGRTGNTRFLLLDFARARIGIELERYVHRF